MNTICDYDICTGCQSCKEACPVQAISMKENERGFVYPKIDNTICIDCKKCQKVCPSLNIVNKHLAPQTVYAIWINDKDNRKFSTSGGMGYLLSKWIVEQGGVFCGCRWNIDHAEHICCEQLEDLHQFQGSKYTYSDINESYYRIKAYLKEERKVLFVGTPCQVAGLKSYLSKDYDNLITVDLVCHGIPSMTMLRHRISTIEAEYNKKVVDIRFRHKLKSQYYTCMKYIFNDGTSYKCTEFKDPYFRGFDSNYYLRENCFNCMYSTPERVADITIADFWGYQLRSLKYRSYRKGTSLLLVNSLKGECVFDEIKPYVTIDERPFSEASKGNRNLHDPQEKPLEYEEFWKRSLAGEDFSKLHIQYFPPIADHEIPLSHLIKRDIRLLLKELHTL